MPELTHSVTELIDEFAKMPGIGKKSAERLAYHVLRIGRDEALALAEAIRNVKENVRYCRNCYNLAEEEECEICRDPRREHGPAVRGRAAPRPDGPGAGGHVPRAVSRAVGADRPAGRDRPGATDHRRPGGAGRAAGSSRKLIMATNPTVEGDGTALHISNLLRRFAGADHPAGPWNYHGQRARIC